MTGRNSRKGRKGEGKARLVCLCWGVCVCVWVVGWGGRGGQRIYGGVHAGGQALRESIERLEMLARRQRLGRPPSTRVRSALQTK